MNFSHLENALSLTFWEHIYGAGVAQLVSAQLSELEVHSLITRISTSVLTSLCSV